MDHGRLVLVTGATGAIGPRVVDALLDAGYTVRTLSLELDNKKELNGFVDAVVGNITDRDAVVSAMKGVSCVIHLAALLHEDEECLPPEAYKQVNIEGTRIVVESAMQEGVERIVFASTISVYEAKSGHISTEGDIPRPVTYYGKTKLIAEQIVLDAKNYKGEKSGTVLRFGSVYGENIRGNYQKLFEAIKNRRFIPIGAGRNRRSMIYDKDLARAIISVLDNNATLGDLMNLTDGKFYTLKEIQTAIYKALGRRYPRFRIPIRMVSWSAVLMQVVAGLIRIEPFFIRKKFIKYTEDFAVSGDKCRRLLLFKPHYSLESGWKELAAYRRGK